jgi:hypothetical protein
MIPRVDLWSLPKWVVDLPQWVIDWSQVFSAGLGLLALVVALFATWKAKRDLVTERRRAHELEILRDLGEILDRYGAGSEVSHAARSALLMLPGSEDLPMVRVALDARPSEKSREIYTAKYPDAKDLPVGLIPPLSRGILMHDRLQLVRRHDAHRPELDEAIERRMR